METLSPVPSSLVRYLAVLVLSAAAVLVQMSPARAQAGGPFGVPCDSAGVNGIPYVPGVNCRLMAVDGYTRKYIVLVPPGGVPAGSPAVFMLHGASGNGGQFLISSGWREKATQENFIAIFPTAVEHFVLENQRFSTRWNNYDLPSDIDPNRRPAGYPATSPWPADDVKFIRQIGGDVIQRLSTDPHRVYVAGFSSGGGMCARIGVESSDLIAAVACHSSGLRQVHETLVGSRNLSAFFTLGTRDENALEVSQRVPDRLGTACHHGAAARAFRLSTRSRQSRIRSGQPRFVQSPDRSAHRRPPVRPGHSFTHRPRNPATPTATSSSSHFSTM